MRVRLTLEADRDLVSIARNTLRYFGPVQAQRYAQVIGEAISLIGKDPERASSQRRDDLRAGVRSFHIALAARRRSAASHVLYYRIRELPGESPEVVILRIIGDEMEPKYRVVRAIQTDKE